MSDASNYRTLLQQLSYSLPKMQVRFDNFLKVGKSNQFLKQEYLAHKLGISPSNLSRIENGRLEPTFSIVVKCSEILMIKVFDLIL